MENWLTLVAALGFAFIHYFSSYLTFKRIALRQFISFSGGVAIAYIFIHLLPQLSHGQEILAESASWHSDVLSHYFIYTLSLTGLVVYYTLDRIVIIISENQAHTTSASTVEENIYTIHLAFFVLYNALIGYLLTTETSLELLHLFIYFCAISLHFITNDWAMRYHHKEKHDHFGRFLLSFGILFGWVMGMLIQLPEYIILSIEAFVIGAMILNTIKDEIPSEKEGQLEGFLLGVFLSSILLFLL